MSIILNQLMHSCEIENIMHNFQPVPFIMQMHYDRNNNSMFCFMSKDNNDRKQCELSAMIRTSIKTLPKNRVNFYHKKLGGGNFGNILRHNPLLPTLLKLGVIRLGK